MKKDIGTPRAVEKRHWLLQCKVSKQLFSKKGQVAKFYFIVDRLDLLKQASENLKSRLVVHNINSREAFAMILKRSLHNNSGAPEITVVNIQKFQDDHRSKSGDYNLDVQRVF